MRNLSPILPSREPESSHANGNAIDASKHATASVLGPRKLVRPKMPARALEGRSYVRREESPMLAHQLMTFDGNGAIRESTHAEAFYFQKQVQSQTVMVFVLEDGDRIEGMIEWYDRNVIKVRNSGRTLIYKASIKYLYKAGENGQ